MEIWATGFIVNVAAAVCACAARAVSIAGAAVGIIFGTVLYGAFAWRGWMQLAIFFVIGSLATHYRYREKAARGIGEAGGGARGARKGAAKCAVPVLLAIGMIARPDDAWKLAVTAAFATALADTLGSEIGPLFRSEPRHPFRGRVLSAGTPGGVSVAGTLAGVAGAEVCAAAAVASGFVERDGLWWIPLAAMSASYVESIAGALFASRSAWRAELLNLFNTALGAGLVTLLAHFLRRDAAP